MLVEEVGVEDIHQDPANVRTHSGKNLDAIKASLSKFGQQKPIVIDKKGIVLAGNGTLAAAREMGWATINIVRTDLDSMHATAYAIADNRTAELAEWDYIALGKLLSGLDLDVLCATGFQEHDLKNLTAPYQASEDAESLEDFEPDHDKGAVIIKIPSAHVALLDAAIDKAGREAGKGLSQVEAVLFILESFLA